MQKGATDTEIKELLCRAFGIWGSGPGYTYSGGTVPQFWCPSDREWTDETKEKVRYVKPTLSGRNLILAVRMIYGIRDTGAVRERQMEMFTQEAS